MPYYMYIVGIVTMFINAWTFSFCGVIARYMKEVSATVIIFWYAVIGCILLGLGLAVEHVVEHGFAGTPRIFTYSAKNQLIILIASAFNAAGMVFSSIAWQTEKSAFIALVGYVSVIYSFIMDITVFDQQFQSQQMVGAVIVLVFNMTAIVYKILGPDDE